MKSTDKISQIRATYIDTKKAQKKIRKKLDQLIKENRPLTEEERDDFFDILADSQLGLGTKEYKFWLKNNKCFQVNNLEEFIRELSYHNTNMVEGDFFFKTLGHYKEIQVSIGELWEHIRNKAFGIHAEALAASMRMSKEQTHLGPSPAGKV